MGADRLRRLSGDVAQAEARTEFCVNLPERRTFELQDMCVGLALLFLRDLKRQPHLVANQAG